MRIIGYRHAQFGTRKLTRQVDYCGEKCIIYIKYFKNITELTCVDAFSRELLRKQEQNEVILILNVDFCFNRQYCNK